MLEANNSWEIWSCEPVNYGPDMCMWMTGIYQSKQNKKTEQYRNIVQQIHIIKMYNHYTGYSQIWKRRQNKLCSLQCSRHNMPPLPSSGVLNSHLKQPRNLGWTARPVINRLQVQLPATALLRATLDKLFTRMCLCATKQYKLVPANEQRCSAAGKATVCLASPWPRVTVNSSLPPLTGLWLVTSTWALKQYGSFALP